MSENTQIAPLDVPTCSASFEVDTAPEQWRSQCLVARIQRDEYRAALKTLHATIQRRMLADDPSPEDRLAIWSAWKAAGQIISPN